MIKNLFFQYQTKGAGRLNERSKNEGLKEYIFVHCRSELSQRTEDLLITRNEILVIIIFLTDFVQPISQKRFNRFP